MNSLYLLEGLRALDEHLGKTGAGSSSGVSSSTSERAFCPSELVFCSSLPSSGLVFSPTSDE